ncbi:class I SAM-dependent methyltransferase [Promicromonospora sukumoe]|uniref:SAM-dependent methyltransferase n=1 Tax=Promicromonospora sukumoe TaxID=88382 RepID=A0A7W3PFH6_9MICO|nr:class I SAM-dependent methyltransferase [Promicromonospora sukumoe]MBA8810150.1 SAM-dependent methyltransferase [Promicromonospora sukumoe]
MTSSEQLAAVRADYDDKAEAYTAFIGEAFGGQPLNHVMVGAFADLVRQSGGGQVADVGCGPGHVTAYLRDRGVDAFGVDLSPRLVAAAREASPGVRFDVGDMNDMGALGVGAGSLAGVLANYSVIHTPPDALPATLAELARVLAPGGHLLLSFQALDAADAVAPDAAPGAAETAEPFDHKVSPAWRYSPDHVAGLLGLSGVTEVARLIIAPGEDPARGFPQAHLLGRRAA